MQKNIVCQNATGRRLTIAHSFPFFLLSINGIYDIRHTVTTAKGYNQDGETSTGSTADKRNIVIIVQVKEDYLQNRNALFDFFQPKETGTLFYNEENISRKIDYEVESISTQESGTVRNSEISLICADPLFRDVLEKRVQLSAWIGCIEFPLKIVNPFEVTKKVNTLMQNIYNNTASVLGLRIRFTASGEVTNPSITDVTRHTVLKINAIMHTGDTIEITTGKSAKRAFLTHGGKRSNIINLIDYPPQWPQLNKGDNVYRYDADAGIDALSADIFYTKTYWGC